MQDTLQPRSYAEELEYLFGLQKYGIKFGLSQTANLLHSFGDPHAGRVFVHVGGTNGKGSVASFLASILKEAGLKVGLFTSPHLVRFTERFRINDREMDREQARKLIAELRARFSGSEPPTFFEAVTAMALVHFARQGTDLDILEVGMGGRLDATNVVSPALCMITNISLEHQEFLGDTLLDVAREKAGIIKSGAPLLTGAEQPQVVELFERTCREQGVPCYRLGRDFDCWRTASGLSCSGMGLDLQHLRISLSGEHQARNAALAIAGAKLLRDGGYRISDRDIEAGLKQTRWTGRMQVVARDPLIVLDGAHNPAAAETLASSIRSGFSFRRLILVLGIMADKNVEHMLAALLPASDYAIHTRPVYPRALDPSELQRRARPWAVSGEAVPDLPGALRRALEVACAEDLILVTGSLFTVGEALTFFDPVVYEPDPTA
jgi:dihydrofolate synthase/folylpolyglutamate synthase